MPKARVDQLLVSRGLAPSRERAQALVLAGKVFSGERRVEKAGDRLLDDAALEVRGDDLAYVSRGGLKLEGALDDFGFDPQGLVAADIGASTGGFTDCLLQRGAAKVYAIDVGWGQLHPKLRNDARVVVMERTNARHLTRVSLGEPIDVVVIDASFIGLDKLLPAAHAILREGGETIAMVKPQFEVGPDLVGAGGVVRDEKVREEAILGVIAVAATLGFVALGRTDARIKGPKGNHEAFVRLKRVATASADARRT
jgi:23S rRNA (cytidine1920-2'-O)/16S rRNA (cytidine1409-2'-O)-methyltransferase